MRLAVAAALICLAGAHAVLAKNASSLVSDMFDRYVQACSVAFSDPQAYVDAVPAQNDQGQPNVSISPDGMVVKVYHARNGIVEDVTFARHSDQLLATCIVLFDGRHQDFDHMMNMMTRTDGVSLYTRELAQAVQEVVVTKPGVTLIGGRTPIHYGLAYHSEAELLGRIEDSTHFFSFVLDAGTARVPSIISVQHGSASFYSAHVIEVGK